MAYIGKQPVVGNFQVCDAISVVNGQAAYTMQVGSTNVEPENANHMLVSLNGVLQKPGSSFTISGATITFASNLATGDVIDFIILLGNVLDIGTPSDSTVTTAKLANSAVDLTSKVTGALPVANGGTALTSGFANGITMVDSWRLTTSFTGNANPISSNLERNDTSGVGFIGTGMTESSGVFTFPSTGIYHVTFHTTYSLNSNSRYNLTSIQATTNNSSFHELATTYTHISRVDSQTTYAQAQSDAYVDVTDTSNVKVRFHVDLHTVGTSTNGGTDNDYTWFRFIRIGDT